MSCGFPTAPARPITLRWKRISSMRPRSSQQEFLRQPAGRERGADQGRAAGRDFDRAHLRWSRQLLLRQLCRAARGVESGADAADRRRGQCDVEGDGQGILPSILGEVQTVKGVRHGDTITFRAAGYYQGRGVLVRTLSSILGGAAAGLPWQSTGRQHYCCRRIPSSSIARLLRSIGCAEPGSRCVGICGSKRRSLVAADASRPIFQKPTAKPAR